MYYSLRKKLIKKPVDGWTICQEIAIMRHPKLERAIRSLFFIKDLERVRVIQLNFDRLLYLGFCILSIV